MESPLILNKSFPLKNSSHPRPYQVAHTERNIYSKEFLDTIREVERERKKKGRKQKATRWGTGDLGDDDTELFKHLPDPQELLEEEAGRAKGRVKRVRR